MPSHFYSFLVAYHVLVAPIISCSHAIFAGGVRPEPGARANQAESGSQWVLAGEFEPVEEVFLGWDEDFLPFFRDTLSSLAGQARISLVVDPSYDSAVVEELILDVERAHGQAGEIGIIDLEIESVWLRDFGPLITSSADHQRVANMRYWDGGANDKLAPRLAADWLNLEVDEIRLELEGGNLQADGTGNCLLSTSVLVANQDHSEERIRQVLRKAFGCSNIELLPPLPGEPTEHVDMFLTFTAPGELIVGRYDDDDDTEASRHLNWIAFYLEERGFLIRRIPMPDQRDGLYRTYTNSLAVNGVVLVPYYVDASLQLEEALRVYAEAYPGRDIIPIESSSLIELHGAVHCAAMTTPRRR